MLRILIVPLVMITFAVNAYVLYRSEEYSETAEYIGLDSEGILVEFTLPALTAGSENVGEFGERTILRDPGEGRGGPVGNPDLPVIRRMVLVPNTGDISVEIVSSVSSPLGGRGESEYPLILSHPQLAQKLRMYKSGMRILHIFQKPVGVHGLGKVLKTACQNK